MEDAAFFCRNGEFPFGIRLRIRRDLIRDDDSVDADSREHAIGAAFAFQQRVRDVGTNLAVNGERRIRARRRRAGSGCSR